MTQYPIHDPKSFGETLPLASKTASCACGSKTESNKSKAFITENQLSYLDLLELAPEVKEGEKPAVKRVLSKAGANLVLANFQVGQALTEHQAKFPITVSCLRGEIIFSCGSESIVLTPGKIIHLPAQVLHRVHCQSTANQASSIMLLTMLTASD